MASHRVGLDVNLIACHLCRSGHNDSPTGYGNTSGTTGHGTGQTGDLTKGSDYNTTSGTTGAGYETGGTTGAGYETGATTGAGYETGRTGQMDTTTGAGYGTTGGTGTSMGHTQTVGGTGEVCFHFLRGKHDGCQLPQTS